MFAVMKNCITQLFEFIIERKKNRKERNHPSFNADGSSANPQPLTAISFRKKKRKNFSFLFHPSLLWRRTRDGKKKNREIIFMQARNIQNEWNGMNGPVRVGGRVLKADE